MMFLTVIYGIAAIFVIPAALIRIKACFGLRSEKVVAVAVALVDVYCYSRRGRGRGRRIM